MKKLILTVLLSALAATGATKTWSAAANGTWATAGNWSPSGVPGVADSVVFDATSAYICTVKAQTAQVNALNITNNYSGKIFITSAGVLQPGSTNKYPLITNGTFYGNNTRSRFMWQPNGTSLQICTLTVPFTIDTGCFAFYTQQSGLKKGYVGANIASTLFWNANETNQSGGTRLFLRSYSITAYDSACFGGALNNDTMDLGTGKLWAGKYFGVLDATYKYQTFLMNAGEFSTGYGTVAWPATWTVNTGTSRMVLFNAAKATISIPLFYDLIDSSAAGVVDSFAVHHHEHDHIHKGGKLKFGGFNDTVDGNFTVTNACTDSIFCRLNKAYLVMTGSDPTVTIQNKATNIIDSLHVQFNNSGTMVLDSPTTIWRFLPTRQAAAQRYTMQSSVLLTLSYGLDYTWSGTGTAVDTMKSSSAGNKARVKLAAAKTDSLMYIKDMAFQSYALTCTTNCTNGLGDSNVVFKASNGAYYMTPSVPTITTVSPAVGLPAGGWRCSLTVATELFPPCSASVDGGAYVIVTVIDSTKGYFTTPAHSAGTVNLTVKNADMQTGTKTNALTYQSPPDISYTTPVTDTVSKAASHAVTNSGGSADSFTVSGTALPGGLSLNKTSGLISGTPTTVTGAADYKIVAWSPVGNDTATIRITVVAGCTAPGITRHATGTLYVGEEMAAWDHALTGDVDSVVAVGALPTGLSIAKTGENKGRITGTPSTGSALAGYRIRAYGCADSATVYDSIYVCERPTISYASGITCTLGVAIANLDAALGGGTTDSVKAITTLPTGLSVDKTGGTMGRISGTATAGSSGTYWIKAYGCAASSTSVAITVTDTTARRPVSVLSGGGRLRFGLGF